MCAACPLQQRLSRLPHADSGKGFSCYCQLQSETSRTRLLVSTARLLVYCRTNTEIALLVLVTTTNIVPHSHVSHATTMQQRNPSPLPKARRYRGIVSATLTISMGLVRKLPPASRYLLCSLVVGLSRRTSATPCSGGSEHSTIPPVLYEDSRSGHCAPFLGAQ